MSKRNLSMDFARVVASIMVVFMHVDAAWKYGSSGNIEWKVCILYDCLSRSAVPIFFMLSGAFSKTVPIRNIWRKIIYFSCVFFVSSAIYTISDFAYNNIFLSNVEERFTLVKFLESIMNYKYHLWYLPAYITVLFMSPIVIKVMDDKMNETIIKYMIIVFVFFNILLSTMSAAIRGFDNLNYLNNYISFFSTFMTGNHVGYFVLGRYLINHQFSEKTKKIIYLLGAISTICLYVLTVVYSNVSGYGDDRWLNTLNVFVLLQSIAVFLLAKGLKIPETLKYIIKVLSSYTFGIYLVHVFFLDWFYRLGFFKENMIFGISFNIIIQIPVRVFIIYIISFIVVFIWNKFINCMKHKLILYKRDN